MLKARLMNCLHWQNLKVNSTGQARDGLNRKVCSWNISHK